VDDPEALAKEMIAETMSETAAKVLETTVAINLLNPVAVEVGRLLGDIAGLVRFYATDNMARIFTKWAVLREGKCPLKAEEFKRVMPMLHLASMQSDEELQNLWATLLDAAATDARTLSSFAQTLSQITPEEARFLDHLWHHRVEHEEVDPRSRIRQFIQKRQIPEDLRSMTDFYINTFDVKFQGQSEQGIRDSLDKIRHDVELMLADFERLGLIEKKPTVKVPLFPGSQHLPIESSFAFTIYGERFMITISPFDNFSRES
jgi:hypothetical protein